MPYRYLSRLSTTGIRLGLDRVKGLLERLGCPQDDYRAVIIAGTNGKGSVAAMTASILKTAGFRTGLYTSPHLLDVRERIQIDGKLISKSDMSDCIRKVRQKIIGDVTYFEFLTAIAFLYFSEKKVDIAILEVGMGGRLDATNVVDAAICAITNMALEHTSYLGATLEDIAKEKGAIIPYGGICITAAKQKKVLRVLEEICCKRHAVLYRIGKNIRLRRQADGSFSWYGPGMTIRHFTCSLMGDYQQENMAIAIELVSVLGSVGFKADEEDIRGGLRSVHWEGRLEVLGESPRFVVDGAHNPAAVGALCRSLKSLFHFKRLIVIFGVLLDKDVHGMINRLASIADLLILTDPPTERARRADHYAAYASSRCRVEIHHNPSDALQRAYSLAKANDLICATGSLYLVGELKKFFSFRACCDNRLGYGQIAAK
jgi:dihydrofolate synthase/folylpolyglutamate synthase